MKKFFSLIVIIVLFLFVFAETNYLNNKNILFSKYPLLDMVSGSLGLAVLLFFFPTDFNSKLLSRVLLFFKHFLLSLTLYLIFVEAAIVDFAGLTFGPEVIFHFNWDAFILGVKEYLMPLTLILLFILFINWCVYTSSFVIKSSTKTIVSIIAVTVLSLFFNQSIYDRVFNGFIEYKKLMNVRAVYESEIQDLEFLDIQALTTNKSNISATVDQPKDLIIIYLESFSSIFVNNAKYPNLTPNLAGLVEQYQAIEPYISTGHFTMDGLISSHCGFIPNMVMGNNTMVSGEKYYFNIPCFTDVLQVAGYHQEFWGGAKKSFAGKGEFLLDHGYDVVWGREEFIEEHESEMSWWGLHDDTLFEQVKLKVSELKAADLPFHISLLTLSTHLKGFPSPSCPKYPESDDPFIQAIHCTDYLVGNFISFLKQNNYLTDTSIIVTGDHAVFNTSYTQQLFGPEVDSKKLFGIIIDEDNQVKPHAMGLYDLGPTVLHLLNINHNTSFILGDAFGGKPSRLLITRNEVFIDGAEVQLQGNCEISDKIEIKDKPSLNLCEHRTVINKLYGYTEQYKVSSGEKVTASSTLEVQYENEHKKIVDVVLDGKSLVPKIRNKGIVTLSKSYSKKGVFVLKFNHQKQEIDHLLNFTHPDDFMAYVSLNNDDTDSSLIMFGISIEENAFTFEKLSNTFENIICHDQLICLDSNTPLKLSSTENVLQIQFE